MSAGSVLRLSRHAFSASFALRAAARPLLGRLALLTLLGRLGLLTLLGRLALLTLLGRLALLTLLGRLALLRRLTLLALLTREVAETLADALSGLPDALSDSLPGLAEPLADPLAGLRDTLPGALAEVSDPLPDALPELSDTLSGTLAHIRERLVGALADLRKRLLGALAGVLGDVSGGPEELPGSCPRVLDGPADSAQELWVSVERHGDALDDRVHGVEARIEEGLCLDPVDLELDLVEADLGADAELGQPAHLGDHRHLSPQILDLDLDLVDLDHRHVDDHVRSLFDLARIDDGVIVVVRPLPFLLRPLILLLTL